MNISHLKKLVEAHHTPVSNREMMESIINEIENKKVKILQDALNKIGAEVDWKTFFKSRFKPIVVEFNGTNHDTTYYYNDGSVDGVKLVTFHSVETNLQTEGNTFKISPTLQYTLYV